MMTVYVTTVRTIQAVPGYLSTDEAERLVVLYRDADTMRVEDARKLRELEVPVEFMAYADRDDMLVCLGTVLADVQTCVYLDGQLPVPKRFADRIKVEAMKGTAKPKRTAAKPKATAPGFVVKSTAKEKPAKEDEKVPAKEAAKPKAAAKKVEPKAESKTESKTEATTAKPKASNLSVKKFTGKLIEVPAVIDGIEFKEPGTADLYQMLQITSETAGFSWPTPMLMLSLLRYVEQAEDDEVLANMVKSMHGGSLIWAKMKTKLADIHALDEALAELEKKKK